MRIFKLLTALYPSKACGQDEIPNWMLKEYAELLSFPISRITNLALKEQSLLKIWKFANVFPLPKVKPAEGLKKQLIPIHVHRKLQKSAWYTITYSKVCSSRCAILYHPMLNVVIFKSFSKQTLCILRERCRNRAE